MSDSAQLTVFDLLQVNLAHFEGPLDLLLELIRKHKLDIATVPLAEICGPYLSYLEEMERFNMDVAVEFMDIASTLILIKSKSLLPRQEEETDGLEDLDPEESLRQKLIQYQHIQNLARQLNSRDLLGREVFCRAAELVLDEKEWVEEITDASLYHLVLSFQKLLKKKTFHKPHEIQREEQTLEERMQVMALELEPGQVISFDQLLGKDYGLVELVLCFMSILEWAKLGGLKLTQIEEYGPIHLQVLPKIKQTWNLAGDAGKPAEQELLH